MNDRSTESGDETPRRVRIAVIDTGVDFGHAGIADAKEKGRIREEWCHSWVGADAKDEDDELHGTNCAYLLHKSAPEADIYIEKVFNQNAVRYYEAKNIAKVRFIGAVPGWEILGTTNRYTNTSNSAGHRARCKQMGRGYHFHVIWAYSSSFSRRWRRGKGTVGLGDVQ